MQVSGDCTLSEQMVKLLSCLLHLFVGGVEAGDLHDKVLSIGRIRYSRTQVCANSHAREKGWGTGEYDHGEHAQPGDQQKTPHALETPASQSGDSAQREQTVCLSQD